MGINFHPPEGLEPFFLVRASVRNVHSTSAVSEGACLVAQIQFGTFCFECGLIESDAVLLFSCFPGLEGLCF